MLATAGRLALVWGMHACSRAMPENSATWSSACRIAFEEGFVKSGDRVIIIAGVPLGTPGTTNMVRIAYLDDAGNPVASGDVRPSWCSAEPASQSMAPGR